MSMPRRPIEVAPRVLWRDRWTVARGHGERCRHDLVHPDQLPRDDHAEALCDADGHPRRRTVLLGLDYGVAWKLQDTGRHVGQPATKLMPRGLRAGGRGECQNTRASQREENGIPRAWMALHRQHLPRSNAAAAGHQQLPCHHVRTAAIASACGMSMKLLQLRSVRSPPDASQL